MKKEGRKLKVTIIKGSFFLLIVCVTVLSLMSYLQIRKMNEKMADRLEQMEAQLIMFQNEMTLASDNSDGDAMTYINTPRKKWQIENNIFHLAKENLVDPEELTDICLDADWYDYVYGKFSPFTLVTVYTQEEWESLMTERYLDAWKNW